MEQLGENTYVRPDQSDRFSDDYKSLKLNTELNKHKANHSHAEAMTRMDIEKQLKEQEIKADLELKKYSYRKKLGWLGIIFGGEKEASKNITATICVLTITGMIVLSICAYNCEDGISKIKDIWSIGTPILTLSLGYLFGKN